MDIIQQIAVKAVEEIFESVKITGLNDIGKTIKALTPVVSRTVLSVLTAFLEEMDESLVIGAKALRREDGITVKERGVSRVWLTELGELNYKRTYFRLRDGSFVYLLDHIIGVESYASNTASSKTRHTRRRTNSWRRHAPHGKANFEIGQEPRTHGRGGLPRDDAR